MTPVPLYVGEGTLDVTGVVAATLAAGYAGPLSLEVFSDVVREADPAVTAREAMRSLVFLEDRWATHLVESWERGASSLRSSPVGSGHHWATYNTGT